MPQLREVTRRLSSIESYNDGSDDEYIEEEVAYSEWPVVNQGVLQNSSSSVRKLSLHLQVGRMNTLSIKTVFPNVTFLKIVMEDTNVTQANLPPFQQIWERWPDLEEFYFGGKNTFLERNCDADFCGIHEEEAELLRGMDEGYFKAVQIVPIRPCPLTMPS